MSDQRRLVPRTDQLLADPRLRSAADRLGADLVKAVVRSTQERCRSGEVQPDQVAEVALAMLPRSASSLQPVINATGVIVHTNLGRAPLSAAAVEAIVMAAGATDVELNLVTGRRDRRGRSAMAALAKAVPDAEDVHVVNNGAAALALAACALAADPKDTGRNVVVIARGELVEIGDGFRIPELLESVGAVLREVGTTNRVRLADYADAIDEQTAFILKVHPSNFVMSGFTSAVSVTDLAGLGAPVVCDIGSGLLTPHPRLPDEPSASASLRSGATLVTASGDKLLGGPQCGLLLGRAAWVQRLRRHPLARALRVDKLTLAALEATLTGPDTPVAEALIGNPADLMARAVAIQAGLAHVIAVEVVSSTAAVGGGGAPGIELPSAAIALDPGLAAPLRTCHTPVVGHVVGGRLLLDLIAVPPESDVVLAEAIQRVVGQGTGDKQCT